MTFAPAFRLFGLQLLVFALALLGSVGMAHADPGQDLRAEIAAIIETLKKPLSQDVILYRFSSESSGRYLVRQGVMTQKILDSYNTPTHRQHEMGGGLYAAEGYLLNIPFIPENDFGALTELTVRQGTPYVDLSDQKTLDAFKSLSWFRNKSKISFNDITMFKNLLPPCAYISFADLGYWVLKSPEGVTFSEFSGRGKTDEELISDYREIDSAGRNMPGSTYARAANIFGQRLLQILEERTADASTAKPETIAFLKELRTHVFKKPSSCNWLLRALTGAAFRL